MIFDRVTYAHAGVYQCSATSGVGEGVVAIVPVHVGGLLSLERKNGSKDAAFNNSAFVPQMHGNQYIELPPLPHNSSRGFTVDIAFKPTEEIQGQHQLLFATGAMPEERVEVNE